VRDLAGKWDGLFLAYLIRKNYWLRSDGHRLRASEVCPRAARATPDGYTIEMGHMGTHAASVALYPDYMRDQIVNVVQQVQAGQIKAYAVGTPERSPALPDVPTSQQAGLPEFQAQAWNALFAPKNTPQPVLDKVSDALDKALDDEQTRKRLLELGSVLPGKDERGQQALAALVRRLPTP
jgi:hypothetical protein